MFERRTMRRRNRFGWAVLALILIGGEFIQGQETKKAEVTDKPAISISFLPPPLEKATYSVGIYEAKSGHLVRRLKEYAPENAFTVGLNGLITAWDGKDEAGKHVPAGRYAARGYAVGALKVEGVGILGNDWANDDETLRVKLVEAIALIPEDEGLAALVYTSGDQPWELLRYSGADGDLLWRKPVPVVINGAVKDDATHGCTVEVRGENLVVAVMSQHSVFAVANGARAAEADTGAAPAATSPGKDGTVWKIENGVLSQNSASGESLRSLAPKADEPVPLSVSASQKSDRLYLLESRAGWQRVRGLSWVETKEENGKPVSTWKTFFERNVRPQGKGKPAPVEITLAENPLVPGKPQRIRLDAAVDADGSYLVTTDGLRLRRISERVKLAAAHLAKDKAPGMLTFQQTDGAAWDEFSIEGASNMMAFDAGEFEMTDTGEKTHAEKPVEPPDL